MKKVITFLDSLVTKYYWHIFIAFALGGLLGLAIRDYANKGLVPDPIIHDGKITLVSIGEDKYSKSFTFKDEKDILEIQKKMESLVDINKYPQNTPIRINVTLDMSIPAQKLVK